MKKFILSLTFCLGISSFNGLNAIPKDNGFWIMNVVTALTISELLLFRGPVVAKRVSGIINNLKIKARKNPKKAIAITVTILLVAAWYIDTYDKVLSRKYRDLANWMCKHRDNLAREFVVNNKVFNERIMLFLGASPNAPGLFNKPLVTEVLERGNLDMIKLFADECHANILYNNLSYEDRCYVYGTTPDEDLL